MAEAKPCLVNHDLERGVFFALLERQAETRAMLKRAVALVKTAVAETPYWGEAEEFVREADALLERISSGEIKELQPGEEPFWWAGGSQLHLASRRSLGAA
jgi:hypothetical protein